MLSHVQLVAIALKHRIPPTPRILELMEAQREGFERPPPKSPTHAQKNAIILRELQRFDPNPTIFEDKTFNLKFDGWEGHIRQIYLTKSQVPVSQRDVEYYIHLDNYKECKLKSQGRKWGAFIYINKPDHLCNGQYPSIEGTHFGVQHSKHF